MFGQEKLGYLKTDWKSRWERREVGTWKAEERLRKRRERATKGSQRVTMNRKMSVMRKGEYGVSEYK